MPRKPRITISISLDFWILTVFVVLCVFILSFGFSAVVYHSYINEKKDALAPEASQVDYILTDSIQYVDNYARFIGQRIAEHGADDLPYIASLLGGKLNVTPNPQNLFISTLFDWVSPKKEMWISSDRGVFKEPIDMSYRDYLNRTPIYPWTLQVQAPAVGVPSGQWIIPGGMGITDANGKYLGALTLGFAIDGLAKKINAALGNNNIQFVILTKDFNYVGSTVGGEPTDDKFFFVRSMQHAGIEADKQSGFFKEAIEFNGNIYPYYHKTAKYNYVILTGYSKNLPQNIFNQVLFPRLIEFLILGLVVISILFIFKKRTIEPLVQLSAIVDKIAQGQSVRHVPRSPILEMRNLSRQLVNVMRYMNREKYHKGQIAKAKAQAEQAVLIAKEAKAAKEEFLRKLRHELKNPLTTIMGRAEMLMAQNHGPIPSAYCNMAEDIFKCGYQIGTLTTNVLNRKIINTSKVINQCIAVQKDRAYFSNIRYQSAVAEDLPNIYVDEMRFRQIVVGVIHHSLTLTPPEEQIFVEAHSINTEHGASELVITITDTGFGGSESFRKGSIDGMGPQGISRNTDGTDLTIDNIRTLLALHKGTLDIQNTTRKGTVFTISLPYLSERDEVFTLADNDVAKPSNVTPLFKKETV